jgi:hypothetical protein
VHLALLAGDASVGHARPQLKIAGGRCADVRGQQKPRDDENSDEQPWGQRP